MWLLLLIPACVAAVLSCMRLVRIAATADALAGADAPRPAEAVGIGLYETAYLVGGPARVVDLALVLMASRGGCTWRTPDGPAWWTRRGAAAWSGR